MNEHETTPHTADPSYYAIIPANVRYDKELKPNQKLLYGEITCLSNRYGFCWASNSYFAGLYGVAEETVSSWITGLAKKGYIQTLYRQRQSGKERYIWITEASLGTLNEKIKSGINEKIKSGLKEKAGWIYNTINKDNTTSLIDSKESINGSKEPPVDELKSSLLKESEQPPTARSEFVDYWNEQENITRHSSPTTKTYQEAHRKCNQLRHGILGRACTIDPGWMDRNKIPDDFPRKKFTEEEIKEGIRRLALMHKEGYWPYDKSKLPRSLSDMIYNPRSKSSWFLKVMATEPKPISEHIKPIDPDVFGMYRKIFRDICLTPQEEARLIRNVNMLIGKQREIHKYLEPHLGHTSFSGKFGQYKNRFYQTHIDWLTGWCQDIRVETVWKTWGAFVRWARDFHNMEIEPNDDNVRKAKREFKRAEEMRRRMAEGGEQARIERLAHLV